MAAHHSVAAAEAPACCSRAANFVALKKNSWYYSLYSIMPACSEWPAQMFVSVARIQIVSRLQWTIAYDDIAHRESQERSLRVAVVRKPTGKEQSSPALALAEAKWSPG